MNLDKWSGTNITGYVFLGSTGERVHLDESEYRLIIEHARQHVSTDHAVIVGAGQQSTVGTIKEIDKSRLRLVRMRCSSSRRISIVPRSLRTHSSITTQQSPMRRPIPLLLYSMPALTGIKIEPETVARLSEHPNIIGVKDSSNDIAGFQQTVDLCPAEFAVMTGNGTVFLDASRRPAPRVRFSRSGVLFRSFVSRSFAHSTQANASAHETLQNRAHAARYGSHDSLRHRRSESRARSCGLSRRRGPCAAARAGRERARGNQRHFWTDCRIAFLTCPLRPIER